MPRYRNSLRYPGFREPGAPTSHFMGTYPKELEFLNPTVLKWLQSVEKCPTYNDLKKWVPGYPFGWLKVLFFSSAQRLNLINGTTRAFKWAQVCSNRFSHFRETGADTLCVDAYVTFSVISPEPEVSAITRLNLINGTTRAFEQQPRCNNPVIKTILLQY